MSCLLRYSMKLRRMLLVLVLTAVWAARADALTPDDLKPFGADDFDAKSALIAKLVNNGDAASLTMLQALAEDTVAVSGSGEI